MQINRPLTTNVAIQCILLICSFAEQNNKTAPRFALLLFCYSKIANEQISVSFVHLLSKWTNMNTHVHPGYILLFCSFAEQMNKNTREMLECSLQIDNNARDICVFPPPPPVLWVSLSPIPECQGLQCWNHTFASPSVHQTCCYQYDRYCYCYYVVLFCFRPKTQQ